MSSAHRWASSVLETDLSDPFFEVGVGGLGPGNNVTLLVRSEWAEGRLTSSIVPAHTQ